MKKLWFKLKCYLGYHVKGYPHGITNLFGYGYRVEYYTCEHCKKTIHWSVKVDY